MYSRQSLFLWFLPSVIPSFTIFISPPALLLFSCYMKFLVCSAPINTTQFANISAQLFRLCSHSSTAASSKCHMQLLSPLPIFHDSLRHRATLQTQVFKRVFLALKIILLFYVRPSFPLVGLAWFILLTCCCCHHVLLNFLDNWNILIFELSSFFILMSVEFCSFLLYTRFIVYFVFF